MVVLLGQQGEHGKEPAGSPSHFLLGPTPPPLYRVHARRLPFTPSDPPSMLLPSISVSQKADPGGTPQRVPFLVEGSPWKTRAGKKKWVRAFPTGSCQLPRTASTVNQRPRPHCSLWPRTGTAWHGPPLGTALCPLTLPTLCPQFVNNTFIKLSKAPTPDPYSTRLGAEKSQSSSLLLGHCIPLFSFLADFDSDSL